MFCRNDLIKFLILSACLLTITHAAPPKPNILFIAIDDLNTCLGSYSEIPGNFLATIYPDPTVRKQVIKRLTPNLDALASKGRSFTNAMCQSPLCGPSRTSLMTGVATHSSGYYMHNRNFRTYDTLKHVVTLPQYLKNNGYFTAGVGKLFHTSAPKGKTLNDATDWPDIRNSWNVWISHSMGVSLGSAKLPDLSPRVKLMQFGASNLKPEETADWQNAIMIADTLRKGTVQTHDKFLNKTITLSLPQDKPFFLGCGIFRPHLPFFAPQSYFKRFPTSEMALDRNLLDTMRKDCEDLPPAGKKWTHINGGHFKSLMDRGREIAGDQGQIDAWRQCVQAYLACVAFADDCVGQILNALEESPYRDNTVIILWSDHGYFLGEKYRLAKQCLWREATNCVLMAYDPRPQQQQRGQACRQIVSLSDLYPTIVSLTGLRRPAGIIGNDITPLINQASALWQRDSFYATYFEGNHMVLNNQYRYIRYHDGGQELYDQQSDPDEHINLAGIPQYTPIIQKMDTLLEQYLNEGNQAWTQRPH